MSVKVLVKQLSNPLAQSALLAIPLTKAELVKLKRSAAGPSFYSIDKQLNGALSKELKRQQFVPSPGKNQLLRIHHDNKFHSVLIIGWPEKSKTFFDELKSYRDLGATLTAQASALKVSSVSLAAQHLDLADNDKAVALIEGLQLGSYTFTRYQQAKDEAKQVALREVLLLGARKFARKSLEQATATSLATAQARDLVNMPPNDCTPSYLKRFAQTVAKKNRLKIQIFDRRRLERMRAGSLLSVAQGSSEPPFLIKLSYRPKGKKSDATIALVGKGVTFDSGGYSIKTGQGMMTMKCDMSGAAAVICAMQAIGQLKPRIAVDAYIPTVENMINGQATRPGDVVKASNGKTIEILNTDAEGRLILADALVLAEKDGAKTIVDIATLTGACVTALGDDYAGYFTDDDELSKSLAKASELASERLWRMPLAPEYREQIKSSVADIKNIGGSSGGAITAALFLKEFVKKARWAHLDIAGPAFTAGDKGYIKKGGVGFGVRTLVNLVLGM